MPKNYEIATSKMISPSRTITRSPRGTRTTKNHALAESEQSVALAKFYKYFRLQTSQLILGNCENSDYPKSANREDLNL
jgi:hypothetical protein